MKKRPCTNCSPSCDSKGCYDKLETITINDKTAEVWLGHCKTRDRISNLAMRKVFK